MSATGSSAEQLVAVGQVVGVEVGRIDDDLLFEPGAVVLDEPAEPQGGVEAVGADEWW